MPIKDAITYDTTIGRIKALLNSLSAINGVGSITVSIYTGSHSHSGNFMVYNQKDQDNLMRKLDEINNLAYTLAISMPGEFQTTFSFNQKSFIVEHGREIEIH